MPQFVLEDAIAAGAGGACNIIVTQPRRISATGLVRAASHPTPNPIPCVRGTEATHRVEGCSGGSGLSEQQVSFSTRFNVRDEGSS